MFGSILYRMILWELTKVFTMSLVGITGILLMAGIIAEASQQGLNPAQVLAIIPLLIPSTLPYTIPATTLFATCVVYGRLAADNEILAIKAAGINIMKVVWPGAMLGLMMSCFTMGMYYRIIPYTHSLMRSMFINDVEASLYSVLERDHAINQPRLAYAVWVHQVQGRKLLNALFKQRDENDTKRYKTISMAREAEIRVDMPKREILLHMKNCIVAVASEKGWDTAYFDDRLFPVPLPDAFDTKRPRRARDLSWREILQRRRELVQLEEEIEAEIALRAGTDSFGEVPPDLQQHVDNLAEKHKYTQGEVDQLDAELWMRPALSCGCLCFVLVGCPVGIWFSRSDYLSAFITCFLPIVFVYYPLMLCGTNLAKEGKLHPALSIWAADAILALISLFLFKRLLRN